MWYIETMEYHLAFNRKEEILSHATLMNIKDIILSEICQLKAANAVWFYLYERPGIVRL